MEFLHFILKYIPFWSVPTCIICLQFTLIYRERDCFKTYIAFIIVGFISLLFTIYYIWAGGGDMAVKHFMDIYHILTAPV